MKITLEEVERVAHLARLSLTDEEKVSMTKDMEMILEFAGQINNYKVEDINATSHVYPINNVFREDRIRESMDRDELLANAPSTKNGCYSVPKVVE